MNLSAGESTLNVIILASNATFLVLLAFTLFYFFAYRPWSLNWGATDEEVNRQMPGDGILEGPTFIATRAISIQVSPKEVWPWIVQIGYQRAGFYSYDRLDNGGVRSSDCILPEYQGLQVGGLIPMTKDIHAKVVELEPPRSMVMDFKPWIWSWGLYETAPDHTRLVTRIHYHSKRDFTNLMVEMFEIFMMRKCLIGIKQRVESRANLSE